ncbi:MAG: cytochrome P450, partial [Myxococcales bacterium]|nr:cytochrome P450 [Myxococcales bacterium]
MLGHIPSLMSRGFMGFVEESWRRCGDCFEIRVGGQSVKIVVHPDDVEAILLTRRERYIKGDAYAQFRQVVGEGLITSEGELWRRQRRLIQPSFTRQNISDLGGLIVRLCDRTLASWPERHREGEPFDVHDELMRLTLEIIGRGLFSLELGDERANLSTHAFGESLEVLGRRIVALVVPPPWLPTPANRKLQRSIEALDSVVHAVVEGRRERGELGDDLLAALLRGRDEEGELIDDQQIHDEVITMFLAGHETTAVALSW